MLLNGPPFGTVTCFYGSVGLVWCFVALIGGVRVCWLGVKRRIVLCGAVDHFLCLVTPFSGSQVSVNGLMFYGAHYPSGALIH